MKRETRPRKNLIRLVAVGVSITVLGACNGGSDASPTTTPSTPPPSIAAPTTVATPTSPPTTAAPTTTATTVAATTTAAPTTTISGTPEEVAKAEVLKTLDAFWADVDACFAAPNDCDKETVIDTYTNGDPTNEIVDWFNGWIDGMRADSERSTRIEDNETTVARLEVEGTSAVTTQCRINRSVRVRDVNGKTEVVNDGVGYARYDLIWERQSDRWIIRDSIFGPLKPGMNEVCPF